MDGKPSRPKTKYAALAGTAGVVFALLSAPQMAQAASVIYANYQAASEYQVIQSATTTIRGGTARTPGSDQMRVYTQTITPGVGINASNFGDNGATANLVHLAIYNAKERCFWDFVIGNVSGTIQLLCTRTY